MTQNIKTTCMMMEGERETTGRKCSAFGVRPLNVPSYGWDNEYNQRSQRTISVLGARLSSMETHDNWWRILANIAARTAGYGDRIGTWSGPSSGNPLGHRDCTSTDYRPYLRWNWPVDVTYSYRGLTEAERRAQFGSGAVLGICGKGRGLLRSSIFGRTNGCKLEHGILLTQSHTPSHTGHHDTVRNIWEWTEDQFNLLKFLRCTTCTTIFPRPASTESIPWSSAVPLYEVDPILEHANSPIHGLHFPQHVANLMVTLNPVRTNNRALDVWCSAGGSSFGLAKSFAHVEDFYFR